MGWVAIEVLTMYLVFPETKGHSLETMPQVFGAHVLDTPEDKLLVGNEADLVEVGGGAKEVDKTGAHVDQVEDTGRRVGK